MYSGQRLVKCCIRVDAVQAIGTAIIYTHIKIQYKEVIAKIGMFKGFLNLRIGLSISLLV